MAAQQRDERPTGSRGALEETYAEFRVELRRFFAMQAHDRNCVDDLVHEVYEAVLRYPSSSPIHDPPSYLFRIAWRVVKQSNRRAQMERQRYVHCDEGTLDVLAQQVGSLWIGNDGGDEVAQEELQRALGQLSESVQLALIRRSRDGFSYKEIAAELCVSPNTVKDYIVEGLDHLREHFSVKSTKR